MIWTWFSPRCRRSRRHWSRQNRGTEAGRDRTASRPPGQAEAADRTGGSRRSAVRHVQARPLPAHAHTRSACGPASSHGSPWKETIQAPSPASSRRGWSALIPEDGVLTRDVVILKTRTPISAANGRRMGAGPPARQRRSIKTCGSGRTSTGVGSQKEVSAQKAVHPQKRRTQDRVGLNLRVPRALRRAAIKPQQLADATWPSRGSATATLVARQLNHSTLMVVRDVDSRLLSVCSTIGRVVLRLRWRIQPKISPTTKMNRMPRTLYC